MADNAITDAQLADAAVDTAELTPTAVTAAGGPHRILRLQRGHRAVAAPTADAHAATDLRGQRRRGPFLRRSQCALPPPPDILSGTQTVDGVSLGAGDHLLVDDQSTASAGQRVCRRSWRVVRAGRHGRGPGEFSGTAMFVQNATYADTAFVCTNDGDVTVGTTAIRVVQLPGNGSIVGGDGIAVTGNSVAVDLATSAGLEISGAKLRAKVKANSGIGLNADGLSVLQRMTCRSSSAGNAAPAPGRQHAGPGRVGCQDRRRWRGHHAAGRSGSDRCQAGQQRGGDLQGQRAGRDHRQDRQTAP